MRPIAASPQAGGLGDTPQSRMRTFPLPPQAAGRVSAGAGHVGDAQNDTRLDRAPAARGLTLRIERQRNPRLLGALAYAMPLLPALALLLRERRNRFVRAHAAQALVFFAALALAQVALYALLVVAGGQTTSTRTAIVLAAVFAVAWLVVAALGFVAWARLVAAALTGYVAALPLVTPLARGLLRGLDRVAGRRRATRNSGERARGSSPPGPLSLRGEGEQRVPRRMTFD